MKPLAGVAQDLGRAPEAGLRDGAQHTRGPQLRVLGDGRVDPLGREGDEHVLAHAQPALRQRLDEELARGADVCRRGQHERLAAARVLDDRCARAPQHARVRTALLVDRGRHADQDHVGGVERVDALGQREALALEIAAEVLLLGAEELSPARAYLLQARGGDVDPDDPRPGPAQRDRRGQPDVAQADDRDHRLPHGDRLLEPSLGLRQRCRVDRRTHRKLRRHRVSLGRVARFEHGRLSAAGRVQPRPAGCLTTSPGEPVGRSCGAVCTLVADLQTGLDG